MAPAKRSRATSPFSGSSRIAGYRPFSSHAWKKNVQSTYSRRVARSSSTSCTPVNGGTARSSACHSIGVRRVRASRSGSNGLRPFSACSARSRSWSARFSASSLARRSPSRRSADDPDDARGVEDVHRRLPVLRRDAYRGVLPRGRRASDEEREVEPAALHLLRDADHLVERRRDEPGEADDVAVLLRPRRRGCGPPEP